MLIDRRARARYRISEYPHPRQWDWIGLSVRATGWALLVALFVLWLLAVSLVAWWAGEAAARLWAHQGGLW